jgi:dolichol kinase
MAYNTDMALILSILTVFLLLLISEYWWRTMKPHDEISRKFIHITVGSFVAVWPQFLSWNQIVFLSLAFLVVVSLSLKYGIFRAIHAVERPTWGEFCFAGAVGLLAIFVRDPLIFAVAILHMSLADGLAALVGTAYGRKSSYMVLGHRKSIIGTASFLLTSLFLLVAYGTVVPVMISPASLVVIAFVASGLENIAVRGLDNLFVPLFIAGMLTVLS